jgi:acetylglutamate kinase
MSLPHGGRGGGLTVLKVGGRVLDDGGAVLDAVARAWAGGDELLLVHGGGDELSRWLGRLGIGSRFVEGQRVTTEESLPVALMVLGGLVNRRLVEALLRRGCHAVGLTGADGGVTRAERIRNPPLGAVGRVVAVHPPLFRDLIAARRMPVVASLACDGDGGWLNVNADLMAAALAAGLQAARLLMMTDVPGVRAASGLLPRLTLPGLQRLLASGEARDGMIPKLLACREALLAGVPEVRILGPQAAALAGALAGVEGDGTRVVIGTEGRPAATPGGPPGAP